MNSPAPAKADSPRLFSRQSALVLGVIASLFIVFFLFNLDRWFFLKSVFQTFDEKLEQRLYSIGVLSSEIIENMGIGNLEEIENNPLKKLLLESQLREIKTKNFLEAVYIVDKNLRVLAEGQLSSQIPVQRTYIREDSLFLRRAFQGHVTASRLHEISGQYFKNGYAPLHNALGKIVGLLVIEASDRYFATLKSYKKTFWVTLLASVLLFGIFSAFIWGSFKKLLRMEASLRESERLAFMGKMAAVLAHEIRNPLGIIRGTADVLKNKYQNGEEAELFDYIPAEVSRLNALITNFLTFSREQKLEIKRFDLVSLLDEIVRQIRLDERAGGLVFQKKFEAEKLEIEADENLLKQVFLNILQNAVQASPPTGKIILWEELAERKRRKGVRLVFRDFGTGIKGEVSKIFEPFFTTKSTGTGLGMAISKKIVEAHGGEIWVESALGEGTTVFIWLPLSKRQGK